MKRLFKVGSDRHERGAVTFSWHPEGNFLASAGKNGVVHITDRHGDIVDEFSLSTTAPVISLEWDRDGEFLAVLQDGNGVVPLWNLSSKRVVPLETNLKDPSFLAWSKTGPQLAVGTIKGNLLIYNKARKQKIPIVGKHSKRITCGAWSAGNKLVLGGEDRTLTISNAEGDTLLHTDLKYTPLQTWFTRSSDAAIEENIVSANLNGKSLLLYNIMDDKDDPMELTFAPRDNGGGCRYGELVHHHWYQDNLVIIGFSGGYLVSVSTSPKELGEEKFCTKVHNDNLSCFAYNPHLKRVATAGNDGVRIIDVRDFKEIKSDYIPLEDLEDGRVTSLSWSPDGQILTVATSAGNVYNFLAKMSAIYATYKTTIGYLSSLREISVVDAIKRGRPIDVSVKLEPSIIAIGANHVAAGMNNRVYFHRIGEDNNAQPVNDQEYVGVVKEVHLNADYAVALTDSKAVLHLIEPPPRNSPNTNISQTFPNREEGTYAKITCVALTDNFLFYGTEAGTVEIFFLTEWTLLSGIELRLNNPIKKLYPNATGTKVVIVDRANQVFLYDAVNIAGSNRGVTQFESAPSHLAQVMWDALEKNVIMLYDGSSLHSFVYIQSSMKGSMLVKLGPVTISSLGEITLRPDKVDIAAGNVPLVSVGGELTCQSSTGSLSTILHPFFEQIDASPSGLSSNQSSKSRRSRDSRNNQDGSSPKDRLANAFCQALALHKLERAWEVAVQLEKRSFYLALSSKAMELLHVEMASRVYNQLEDPGMVMALRDCMNIEDKNLLAGQMALLFCDYQRAQDLFLQSSRPISALEMRKDLMQWDQALKLAHVLAPTQIPDICIQYAGQLEVRDDYDLAMKMFDDALHALDSEGQRVIPDHLVPVAMMGLARCQLRMGNVRQGIRMANELDDHQLFLDAGRILEQLKQYQEAAAMYVKAQQYEQAGAIYTKHLIKNDKARISEAAVILEKVDNDALNASFGKACVAAGRFEDALKAFKRANDWDKVVEIQLKHLDQVQQAFDLVRRSSSAAAAQTVAEYCLAHNDQRGAIEFYLIASKFDEAFKVAQANNLLEVYTGLLGENISAEDALKIAHHYEKNSDFGKAGKFYALCAQYARALRLFLQCGDKEIDAAIDVVGKSQNETLTHQLIDFLVGEKDGVPKDPNYIYRLYLALKKYEDAAKTAMIIARQEQDLGNYALAHKVIVEIIRYLEDASIKVTLQLRQSFVLLHSYTLVKSHVRRGDHETAARLLLRVAQHISKFPMHVVPLLTSTVIECQRAGLKAASYDYAVMLVRPEYRAQIDVNLKRKIEAIVRRKYAHGEGDIVEETTACPISGTLIPGSQLECPTTRDALPMCVVTGRHILLEDACFCPVSKFPAIYSAYVRYIQEYNEGNNRSSNGGDAQGPQSTSETEGKDSYGEPASSSSSALLALTAGDLQESLSAPDPIHGKSVAIRDLVRASTEDVQRYIQRYNNVFEKTEEGDGDGENSGGANEGESGKNGGNNNQEDGEGEEMGSKSVKSGKRGKAQDQDDMDGMSSGGISPKGGSGGGPNTNRRSGFGANSNGNGGSKSGGGRVASKAKLDRIHRSKKKRSGGGVGSSGIASDK